MLNLAHFILIYIERDEIAEDDIFIMLPHPKTGTKMTNVIRKIKVLSLPETMKEKSTL